MECLKCFTVFTFQTPPCKNVGMKLNINPYQVDKPGKTCKVKVQV